ncbi:uncharacterized protein isoform X4 [Danio rerio]
MDSSPHLCLTVRCLEENISAGLPEDHEDPERTMQNQLTRTNSCLIVDGKGQNRLFKMHWESNLVVMKYLMNTRSQKLKGHSTRRQLVNIVVSHMKEIHGRIPTCKQRETYALGIISLFPSLRDPFSAKGYIIQDFSLLFNAETSNKLLERWETAFKHRIINEAKSLTSTARLHCLINSAEGQESENDWDNDVICPTPSASPTSFREKEDLRSVQQRPLKDLCISISLAPALKTISVRGRATSHVA